mgnify:CR=1 FL=1
MIQWFRIYLRKNWYLKLRIQIVIKLKINNELCRIYVWVNVIDDQLRYLNDWFLFRLEYFLKSFHSFYKKNFNLKSIEIHSYFNALRRGSTKAETASISIDWCFRLQNNYRFDSSFEQRKLSNYALISFVSFCFCSWLINVSWYWSILFINISFRWLIISYISLICRCTVFKAMIFRFSISLSQSVIRSRIFFLISSFSFWQFRHKFSFEFGKIKFFWHE